MNASQPSHELPKGLAQKLRAIRRRSLAVTLGRGGILVLSALLGAMALAMALDWFFAWLHPFPRYAATLLTLALVFVLALVLRPRRRTIIGTAREVDQSLPQLEERWSTVAELSQSQDPAEVRGSEAMIDRVASEADTASTSIRAETLVSAQPVWRAARWLAGAAAVLAILFAVNFTQASLLLQRFWMPGKNISLTQITAAPANVWVPKGEPLTLTATLKGRVPAEPPQLSMGATPKAMAPKPGAPGVFQHPIEDMSDSFQFRVRSGDGQTPWLSITAVDRPRISEVKLKVTPPDYSHLPRDERNSLPQAVRVLEGSELQVSFRAAQPLERMWLDLGNGQSAQLTAAGDNWYHYTSRPTNSFSFVAAALNKFKLDNKTKPSCRITVYEDFAPTVKILEPSDDISVLPGEKVDVAFEATDDLGLAKAELIIETTKADGETNSVTMPIDLASEKQAGGGDEPARKEPKQVRKTVQIDTKALGLKHGDQLSYTVQVTDTKHSPTSASAEASAQAKEDQEQQTAQNSGEPKPQGERPSEQAKAESKPSDQEPSEQSNNSDRSRRGKEADPKDQQAAKASQSKPDEMSKRMLDVEGQTAACKPRNIQVDEHAGSFDGEKRQKLEIAIDPILKRLDELLAQAQEHTDSLKTTYRNERSDAAKTNLTASLNAVSDLKSRTAGTPYAFIGLQLHNIAQAHISPAHTSLSAGTNLAHIEKASFHITRAREMLAELTRTYETVKRDQQIADAMQRLSKMYQIFLEDTQALLGSGKGKINNYDRKIAEVDEAFAEKLKELLEERKKIMAELAKVLAEDPRMLRRYLAMMELEGTSLRDQFTLLAERQKQVQQQLAQWNATPEPERADLTQQLRKTYAAENRKIAEDAAKLHDNLETWLPRDVKPDQEQVQSTLARAEKIARLAADPDTNSANQALAEMHALRESLPHFSQVQSTNKARMTAYIANRLAEVETLITAHSGQMKITDSLNREDFAKVAEVVQHRLHQETYTLGEKLVAAEERVGHLTEEIFQTAANLNRTVQGDIIQPQKTSVDQLAAREVKPAEQIINKLPPTFEHAEKTFDNLMRLIIAELDKAPPPEAGGGGGSSESLEDILALLEDEVKACEGLGIPCRPINVSLMRDWMLPRPAQGSGQGMGRAQAQSAEAQAQQGLTEAERLQKQARESARRALADAKKQNADLTAAAAAPNTRSRSDAWNKLASRLQKDLLQGRDNTPPEQYRAAIEAYFRILSESTAPPKE